MRPHFTKLSLILAVSSAGRCGGVCFPEQMEEERTVWPVYTTLSNSFSTLSWKDSCVIRNLCVRVVISQICPWWWDSKKTSHHHDVHQQGTCWCSRTNNSCNSWIICNIIHAIVMAGFGEWEGAYVYI